MEYERTIIERGVMHEAVHGQPLDFATIRNPLGHSPTLSQNLEYCQGMSERELCGEIASWLSVDADMVALGNGSDELIRALPQIFLAPGQLCVLPIPTYFALAQSIARHGAEILTVPTLPENGFAYDGTFLQGLLDTIEEKQPGMVWICRPNNPTGLTMDIEALDHIAELTPGLVVVDEAYQEIVDPGNQASAVRLLSCRSNVLVTKTFSKTFGLPEIHVGMAIGHPGVIQKMAEVNQRQMIPERSRASAAAALIDTEHLYRVSQFIRDESTEFWNDIQNIPSIQAASRSHIGIFLLRHREDSLHLRLKRIGIASHDYINEPGLEHMEFSRIGLQSKENNRILLAALRAMEFRQGEKL
ncbi:histidinol-phosphate aminotransferase family protein [Candidatus Gottesmanbacteria bacterium]|nr:histidinol-phosphate aminotransferase family protein [Candidatus Gottesmanbacteria bacterium]